MKNLSTEYVNLLRKWGLSIRLAREKIGLTLQEFSKTSSVNKTDLNQIERGRKFPTPRMAGKLSNYFHKPVDEVFPRYWTTRSKLIAEKLKGGARVRSF